MGSTEAPSWAEQWGAGGIGAMDEEQNVNTIANKAADNKGATGFAKVKAAAATGALKVKTGASSGVKWIKNKCHNPKKSSPKS